MSIPFIEQNDQVEARRQHLAALRELVGNVYPNKFARSQVVEPGSDDTISAVVKRFCPFEPDSHGGIRPFPEAIERANHELNKIRVRVAGRMASPPRVMGKAGFVHLSDGISRLQIYVRKADARAVNNSSGGLIEDEGMGWRLFELLDHGDFIGVEGFLFITKSGELSIHVEKLQFLAKALLPLPDKMHGIHDIEIRQRQRYVDLIAGSLKLEREKDELTPREVFERRAQAIQEMRRILDDHGYVEVETPMLTPLATGALARPFKTHHNALDIDLYARIAPELYLKRLLVGGFEKVYELNRNFRNEGISTRHNPEFTMLEFYSAYMDSHGMMNFCEDMIRAVVFKVLGHTHVHFGGFDLDFSKEFERLTMKEAILKHQGSVSGSGSAITDDMLEDHRRVGALARSLGSATPANSDEKDKTITNDEKEYGQNIATIFEAVAESRLIQPTFITDFPKPISPLSKTSPKNSAVAERFELFIASMECANGFSELNDPEEQYERFKEQMQERDRGDEEAMVMDEDYIRALSYGMPPAAGIGIGIDRLAMLLTNRQSIRDVILFPHLRPERRSEQNTEDVGSG